MITLYIMRHMTVQNFFDIVPNSLRLPPGSGIQAMIGTPTGPAAAYQSEASSEAQAAYVACNGFSQSYEDPLTSPCISLIVPKLDGYRFVPLSLGKQILDFTDSFVFNQRLLTNTTGLTKLYDPGEVNPKYNTNIQSGMQTSYMEGENSYLIPSLTDQGQAVINPFPIFGLRNQITDGAIFGPINSAWSPPGWRCEINGAAIQSTKTFKTLGWAFNSPNTRTLPPYTSIMDNLLLTGSLGYQASIRSYNEIIIADDLFQTQWKLGTTPALFIPKGPTAQARLMESNWGYNRGVEWLDPDGDNNMVCLPLSLLGPGNQAQGVASFNTHIYLSNSAGASTSIGLPVQTQYAVTTDPDIARGWRNNPMYGLFWPWNG